MYAEGDIAGEEPEYDKVTQASLNGIYVKAQEMDRGHNDFAAPVVSPPGVFGDVGAHASDGNDAATHASTHASDGEDAATHASTHASDGNDAATHASD